MDADADANADDEGEAREVREGGHLGEKEDLIGMSGDDTVEIAGGRCMGGAEGRGGGPDIEQPPSRPSP